MSKGKPGPRQPAELVTVCVVNVIAGNRGPAQHAERGGVTFWGRTTGPACTQGAAKRGTSAKLVTVVIAGKAAPRVLQRHRRAIAGVRQ